LLGGKNRKKKLAKVCNRQVTRPLGQLGENYFDYFIFNIVDFGLPRSGAHRRTLAHLALLGGSTSPLLCVRKLAFKTCDFVDISNTTLPTTVRGSTTTLPLIVVVILRQQLAYLYILNHGRDYAALDKS
jgi:hypothetical protein